MKPLRECPQGRHHDCARTRETHLSGNICFVTHLEAKKGILGRQGVDERALTRKPRHRCTKKPEPIFTLTRTPDLAGSRTVSKENPSVGPAARTKRSAERIETDAEKFGTSTARALPP